MEKGKMMKKKSCNHRDGRTLPAGETPSLKCGRMPKTSVCGIDYIKSFDTSLMKVKVAGELKNYHPEDHMDKMSARRTARFTQLALVKKKTGHGTERT